MTGNHHSITNTQWLVGNPSRLAQISALWIGSTGLLILGLQPILLGALLTENRVTYDQLAIMATVEILAIGIGSVLGAFVLSSRHLRLKAAILVILLAFFDFGTAVVDGAVPLIVLRGLAGILEGGMVAIAVELIARAVHAGRYGGYFVSMQTIAQSITGLILSQWAIPTGGSRAGFIVLSTLCLLTVICVTVMPREYAKIPPSAHHQPPTSWKGQPLLSLLCILFFYMFLGSLWAFLEPLGLQADIPATTLGVMVSASLGIQVLAALSAIIAERKVDFQIPLAISALVAIGVSLVLATAPGLKAFWVCTALIGFVWLFVVPFQIQLTVACDATRKTALLVPAAQLFGAALGPVCVTPFISADNFKPVAGFAAICAGLSFAVLLSLIFKQRQQRRLLPQP
ncbi:MFS transporter [Gynuella sp.]|uniref:MFS transporter n=1 Tax=Gynuella sp. TaxID=2969146 RepID=UPI003D0D78D4